MGFDRTTFPAKREAWRPDGWPKGGPTVVGQEWTNGAGRAVYVCVAAGRLKSRQSGITLDAEAAYAKCGPLKLREPAGVAR